jgi:eukaryotic-like serine/threonine-protein kinase
MKRFFQFLFSKTFAIQLGIAFVAIISSFLIISFWLNSLTNHGEYVEVPDFQGLNISELDQFVEDKDITYVITDSIYNDEVSPGEVLKQEPEVGTKVKNGREVYLYIATTMPPNVTMPKLIDCSLRQALSKIKNNGLRIGKIIFVEDDCKNCIVGQEINDSKVLAGASVFLGSEITILVGRGLGNGKVTMPCLYGLTLDAAIEKLTEASLSLGAAQFTNKNNSNAEIVFKQVPSCNEFEQLDKGTEIKLYFTADKSKIPTIPTDTIRNNTTDEDETDN